MKLLEETLSRDIEEVDYVLKEKDLVREEVIKLTREITRLSSAVVSNVHKGEYEAAQKDLYVLEERVELLLKLVNPHPDLKYSGLVYNGLSEYVEARMLYSIVVEGKLPSLKELRTPIVPYLQGLGDLVGELRRLIIRLLNEVKVEEAEKYLAVMELIYEKLKVLDYPDAIMPGVRHKVDVAARLVEDSRVLILATKNSLRCLK